MIQVIANMKDVSFNREVVSKKLEGSHAVISIRVPKEDYYKLNKIDTNHVAVLIIYNADEYLKEGQKSINTKL